LRAVKTAGTIEGDRVIAEMKKSPIDDPLFGHVVVRADGRATHAMYVLKVKSPQQSKSRFDVYDLIETIPPEAAFRPLDPGGCPLVKLPALASTASPNRGVMRMTCDRRKATRP